jgi:hypothetical protein
MDEAQLVEQERSMAAGNAAGYCWVQNPDGPGRCTLPPGHSLHDPHRDVYAHTQWH